MTATTATVRETGVRPRRPLLPLANLALAGAALTVSLIAVTTDSDPAVPTAVVPQEQTQAPARPTTPVPAGRTANGAGDCFARVGVVRC